MKRLVLNSFAYMRPHSDACACRSHGPTALTSGARSLAAWDTDDNGTISRREFGKAMAALGLTATPEQMRSLFDAL